MVEDSIADCFREIPEGLAVQPVLVRFRYCDRCRREWPPETANCPTCRRWLGEAPEERTEWRLAPSRGSRSEATGYERYHGAALHLRLLGEQPTETYLQQVARILHVILNIPGAQSVSMNHKGWLIWTTTRERDGFIAGTSLRQAVLSRVEDFEGPRRGERLRWGIWVDSYVLPCDRNGNPIVSETTGRSIFDFEPENMILASESMYRANRAWERFVAVPYRRPSNGRAYAYRSLGRKRPSALDYANVAWGSPFVGRSRELLYIDHIWKMSKVATQILAISASAGSGKTRVIAEWLRRHPTIPALRANFSLFGGDAASFAAQLAPLPDATLAVHALGDQVRERIDTERIGVLILDDLHWVGEDGRSLLHAILQRLPRTGMLVLLCTRPAGIPLVRELGCTRQIDLYPLPVPSMTELASSLGLAPKIVAEIVPYAKGNPLFLEQFAAWAEQTGYSGADWFPRTMSEVIAARLQYLEEVRLAELRRRASWSIGWMRSGFARMRVLPGQQPRQLFQPRALSHRGCRPKVRNLSRSI